MPDTIVGAQLTLNTEQANTSVKSFKQQLKEAQADVIAISEKFGATSVQAQNAAKKAAELKDVLGDSRTLIDAFNPDKKFNAFAQSLGAVTGGFTAIQGAMGLLGIESEDLQKQMLKVQSAMALSQGLNTIGDSIQSVKNLGAQLVQNLGKGGLIGVAIVGVAALGAALLGVFNGVKELTAQQKALNEINKDAAKIYVQEKQSLDQIVNRIRDVNIPMKERLRLAKDLESTYPNYFKNLTQEGNEIKGLEDGYKRLVKAIALKARVQAAQNAITAQEQKLLELGFKFGITTEQEALDYYEKIKNRTDTFSVLMQKQFEAAFSEREFYKKVIENAQKEIDAIGGDPTPYKGLSDGKKAQIRKEEKEIFDFRKELKKEKVELTEGVEEDPEVVAKREQLEKLSGLYVDLSNLDRDYTAFKKQQSDERKRDEEAEFQFKMEIAQKSSDALGALSELFGRQTAAGKIAALAQIAINTAVGFAQGFRIAQQSAQGTGPAAAFAFPVFWTAQVAAVLQMAARAKSILGAGGTSVSIPSSTVSAPLTPRLPAPIQTTTTLDQNQLNQLGNAAVRAFVTEADINSNRERLTRIARAARLGG